MASTRNVLFIMCDQLRWDYLACCGHPTIRTPNIDALARRGVRFSNAFVQSASCGPSRMSYYTGRYVSSHRAFGNFVPLPIDELTLGDYLRPHGIRVAVDGKTHVEPDPEALARRGMDLAGRPAQLALEGGFEAFDRHDGVLADPHDAESLTSKYQQYLKDRGYDSENPWLDHANSAASASGAVLSGWHMRYADLPARVEESHSETAYTTDRALQFIAAQGDAPWCLHLSYIKPHWPYVAPAPYHQLYGPADVVPAVKSAAELADPHPLYASYLRHDASMAFASEETRRRVIPTYMGLITQVDHHIGRVVQALQDSGRLDETMIVFCSDHGDYLGDHHLGEKELWHDASIKVPMIVVDPSPQADATRGQACESLVEAIDLLPTFLDALDVAAPKARLEGRSLLPLIRGQAPARWREFIVSEFDYSFRTQTRVELGRPVKGCRTRTLRNHEWKYVECEGLPPLLFDLVRDPGELCNVAGNPSNEPVLASCAARLRSWLDERKTCTTVTDEFVENWLSMVRFNGMKIGQW